MNILLVMKVLRVYFLALIFAVCVACDSFNLLNTFIPPSATVNKRFEASQEWNQSNLPLIIQSVTDDYSFFVSSDWHVVNHNTDHIRHFMSIARNCQESLFILALGDFVTTKGCIPDAAEAIVFDAATQLKNDTVLATAGNHDLYFNQWEDYQTYFKTATYAYVVKTPHFQDFFIVLDSGNGTLGNEQVAWLEQLLTQRITYRYCIICTHTNFFRTDKNAALAGNFPIEETARLLNIFTSNNVNIVFNGHSHTKDDITYNAVHYVSADQLQGNNETVNFIKVDVSETINYTFLNQ